ncbi:hypothetical protein P4485_29970 [Bacillus thuringiensis]|nr:hypothetical protein [Bacillus thuringiensis]
MIAGRRDWKREFGAFQYLESIQKHVNQEICTFQVVETQVYAIEEV